MGDELDVVERVLQILEGGATSSTYKYAVLLGLIDLCAEKTDALGWPPNWITTRDLAEKVIESYWAQVRPWQGLTLKQSGGKRGHILKAVEALRVVSTGVTGGLNGVRLQRRSQYEQAVLAVEWKLIQMPLPRLQTVNRRPTDWLYRIAWSQGVKKRDFAIGSQRVPTFDNRILLRSEVAMAFVRLNGLIRPFIEQRWVLEVAKLNRLVPSPPPAGVNPSQHDLHGFLFGAGRTDLRPVRPDLHSLQGGACFYCGSGVQLKVAEVDHFLPWSRHPDNGLDNLVVAHRACNGDKSDHLPAAAHLRKWRVRSAQQASTLTAIERRLQWDRGAARNEAAARALYLRLPGGSHLWKAPKVFEVINPSQIRKILR
jgi:hypothetical protein